MYSTMLYVLIYFHRILLVLYHSPFIGIHVLLRMAIWNLWVSDTVNPSTLAQQLIVRFTAAEGLMRLNGRGCPQDETAGLQLLRKATAGGSLYAAGLLALYYFTSKLFFKATEMALR